jgi:polyisoprenoid-binding protein YceI
MKIRNILVLSALLSLGLSAHAEVTQYKVDPAHSTVSFEIRHLFSKVRGGFKSYSGDISYDAKNVAKSSADFVIQVASVDSGNDKRDGHLKSPDFFDADKFKTITFKSTKVVSVDKTKFKITGDLTMHGVTKLVTFDAEVLGVGPDMMGKEVASFQATTTVNRKDFGIIWNKTLDKGQTVLGEDVKLEVLVEAPKATATAQK